MRRLTIYLILLILVPANITMGQITSHDSLPPLKKLFERLVNNYDDTDRIRINDSIRIIIDGYVRSDTVYQHSFTDLRYLGQITSPDSLLKIVTWNLVLSNGKGKYFCFFIRKMQDGKKNMIYSLTKDYSEAPVLADTTYSVTDWYGALYYALSPCVVNDRRCWVMLGIDYGNPMVTRKIIEVLSFTGDDSIVLGRKWFVSDTLVKYRVVFEYASTATMSLRFKSEKSIVFDHLVPFLPSQKDDHQYYGPDYSYDAYTFENGFWNLKINVDARNKE